MGGAPQDSEIWKKATEWLYQLQLKKTQAGPTPLPKRMSDGPLATTMLPPLLVLEALISHPSCS